MENPIATFDLVVLDTPRPRELADFYCALLGWKIVREDDDWITVRGGDGAGLAFQLAPDHVPPTWPDNTIPAVPSGPGRPRSRRCGGSSHRDRRGADRESGGRKFIPGVQGSVGASLLPVPCVRGTGLTWGDVSCAGQAGVSAR